MSGTETRQQLIDAALRAFAEDGVRSASLLEVTRLARQRNRGAVHYHFGGREGLLEAALSQQSARLREREQELLAVARDGAPDDLATAVEALVRPVTELVDADWQGRCYVVILTDLLAATAAELDPLVAETMVRAESIDVGTLIAERMPPMDAGLRELRVAMVAPYVLRAIAERAKAIEAGREVPDAGRFVDGLVATCTAMLTAPVTTPASGTAGDVAGGAADDVRDGRARSQDPTR